MPVGPGARGYRRACALRFRLVARRDGTAAVITTIRPYRLLAAIAVLLPLGAAILAPVRAQDLQVIELDFRMAQDLIPILEPLLEPGGVLTGRDDVLFVRTSPENLEQDRKSTRLNSSHGYISY